MPIQPLLRHSLPAAERPSGARGAAALRMAAQADLRLTRGDGTVQAFALPAFALPALADLPDRPSSSDAVTVLAEDTEITPEDGASFPGISRPLMRRRIDVGALPFRLVGTSAPPADRRAGASRARGAGARASRGAGCGH